MTGLINDRSRNDGLGLLLPPKICPTPPEGRCYTIVGQVQVQSREGHEEETAGPQTRAEYMMGTEWVLMWKHPQGIDRREGPPLHGWILLVIPVHSYWQKASTSCVNPSLPVYSRFVTNCHISKAQTSEADRMEASTGGTGGGRTRQSPRWSKSFIGIAGPERLISTQLSTPSI